MYVLRAKYDVRAYVHTVLRTIDAKQLSLSPSSEYEALIMYT